jgi:hypothetical protein
MFKINTKNILIFSLCFFITLSVFLFILLFKNNYTVSIIKDNNFVNQEELETQPVSVIDNTNSGIQKQNNSIPTTSISSTSKNNSNPEVINNKFCRPETRVFEVPKKGESFTLYLDKLIKANAPLAELQMIRSILLDNRARAIDDLNNTNSPNLKLYGGMNDIILSPDDMITIGQSMASVYSAEIKQYESMISLINPIINDKQIDGCIDAINLCSYGYNCY